MDGIQRRAVNRSRQWLAPRGASHSQDHLAPVPDPDEGLTGWVDAWHDDGAAGWLSWPPTLPLPSAIVNDEEVPVLFERQGRGDVQEALSLSEPAHGFRVFFEVSQRPWLSDFQLSFAGNGRSIVAQDGRVDELVLQMAARGMRLDSSPSLRRVSGQAWTPITPAAGLANGAITAVPVSPPEACLLPGLEQPSWRPDVHLSRYQSFAYYRHVREHPAYRTARHFTLATDREVVRYLSWSLRTFAENYPYAPLPVTDADLRWLNRPAAGTGLGKGRSSNVSALPLTAAQALWLSERGHSLMAADGDQYATWLTEWIVSWGWGHRGSILLAAPQARFLTGTRESTEQTTVGAVAELNPYQWARLRAMPLMSERYLDLHLPSVRIAAQVELLAEDLQSGSGAFFGDSVTKAARTLVTTVELGSNDPTLAPETQVVRSPEVRVIGMLGSKSGLGQNARHSVAALRSADIECDPFAISVNDRSVASGLRGGRSFARAAINLWHLNPDNVPEAAMTLDPCLYEGAYNVGFFAWELDLHPRAHRLAIDWVDEIWVPSTYCAVGFRNITDKPVVVMPHCLMLPDEIAPFDRVELGIGDRDFLVHCTLDVHSWPQRKNPLGVVEAFLEAFPTDDDVRLLMRIRNGSNIGLVDSDLDGIGESVVEMADRDDRVLIDVVERGYDTTLELLKASDCAISLHRSEGFGYGLAEALALGVPLIATDYGGSRDFCHAGNTWLVPATERLLRDGEYYLAPAGAKWGEPSIAHAVEHLREVRRGGELVDSRVRRGLEESQRLFSLETMARTYAKRIDEIREIVS